MKEDIKLLIQMQEIDKQIFELTDSEDKKMEVLLEKEMTKFLSKL